MKQLLLVKMSSLGDVVHAFPAVSDAAAAGWQIDWVVEEAFADVARSHPDVRHVFPIAWRRWRRNLFTNWRELTAFLTAIGTSKYDVVLDSQGLIKSAIVANFAQGQRAGYSHTSAREPWAAFGYNQRVNVRQAQHAIDRQRQLFAQALSYVPAIKPRPLAGVTAAVSNQVLLLHGTTWDSKHWPEEMWAALVERIIAAELEPVVTWGNEVEQQRAQRLAASGAVLIDRLPMAHLIQTISSMRMVITVDSGLGHLAAALGVPTLGLYGATSGDLTGCVGPRTGTLQGSAPCVPCLKKQCNYRGEPMLWRQAPVTPPCFASVSPERVWTEAALLMSAH